MNQPTSSFTPSQGPAFGDQARLNQAVAIANLTRRVKVGASNFYWIGALSVLNSLISVFGGSITFVIGLAITQIVDAFAIGIGQGAPSLATTAKIIGLVLSIAISGIIAIFGFFAGKGQRWAFITGMVLYGLDALIMLAFSDWIGLAFHVFFLWGLFTGLQALGQLQKVMPKPVSSFPQDIGVS